MNNPIEITASPLQPHAAQVAAIQTILGPVMVLAGPGTGKTFTLTERIVHLLRRGTKSDRILALTFTENAASEMRQRLQDRLGLAARRVSIATFHGFCQQLIQRCPEVFEVSSEVRPIDAVTQFEMIRNALEQNPPQYLKTERGDRFYYVREIVAKISLVKREAIRAEEFHAAVAAQRREAERLQAQARTKTASARAKNIELRAGKLAEFWKIYENYNQELLRQNLTDFDDMILRVVDAFRKRPDFLDEIRRRYDFIHADEFQDNNSAQNEILYGMAGEEPNLFVVGDDDQSIFRFQGACAENFLDFLRRFPKAAVITLNESHRSSPPILDFAHAQISLGSARLETSERAPKISKRLTASHPVFQKARFPVRLIGCRTRREEAEWIAGEISRLRSQDATLRWSDFAVLFRLNREAHELALPFKQAGIPFRIGSSDNALNAPSVQNLLALLRAVAAPENSIALFHSMLFPPFKISPIDAAAMNLASRSQSASLGRILESDPASLPLKFPETILAFRERLQTWRELFRKQSLHHAFLRWLHESGLLEFHFHATDDGSSESRLDPTALNALRSVAGALEEFVKLHPKAALAEWLRHLDLMELYGIPLNFHADESTPDDARVQLLTAHKAKGSEFRVVFVTHACASNWEDRTPRRDLIAIPSELVLRETSAAELQGNDEDHEEERRLLYVAATRARERLYFTRPLFRDEKPLDETMLLAPLRESKEGFLSVEEISTAPKNPSSQRHFAAPIFGESKSAFLKEQIRKLRLSPTALYQYERCPRQFLYAQIYLIPTPTTPHLAYGNAIHEALRRFFHPLRRASSWPPQDRLIEDFLEVLRRHPLESPQDYLELEDLGRRELAAFRQWCIASPPPPVLETEWAVRNVSLPPSAASTERPSVPIPLSGKFDRIDLTPDGNWTVVDYKTGRPRTENDFFGRTKNSDGQYWDQFRFYKLLNQLSKDQPPIVRGRVIYVREPDRSQEFELTEQHAQEIRLKIESIHSQIQSLHFSPVSETQSAEACKHCAALGLCRANL